MKILFRQKQEIANSILNKIEISNCYLKVLQHKNDYKFTTLKSHFHTEHEIHIVVSGTQKYEVDDTVYTLHPGEFLYIPPKCKHRMVHASASLKKYTFICNMKNQQATAPMLRKSDPELIKSFQFITQEHKNKLPFAYELVESRVFEILLLLIRHININMHTASTTSLAFKSNSVELAKQFILDNLDRNLQVTDVAAYCHLCPRQLTRKFTEAEGIPPAKFIHNEKMKQIGTLVQSTPLTLAQISEQYSFSSEYYFNRAFKEYFGLPPATYRKMYNPHT